MDSGELSIFVILGGLLAVALAFSVFNLRARQAAWSEVAAQTGLVYEPGSFWGKTPLVSGVYHGRSLALDTFSTGGGKNRTTYTRLVLSLENQAGISLSLSGEGLGSKLEKLVGMKEITVGDEEIDRRFFIHGGPALLVQRLLANSSLRQKLLDARSVNLDLDDRIIRYQKQGFKSNPETLLGLFDLLNELAVNIERLEPAKIV